MKRVYYIMLQLKSIGHGMDRRERGMVFSSSTPEAWSWSPKMRKSWGVECSPAIRKQWLDRFLADEHCEILMQHSSYAEQYKIMVAWANHLQRLNRKSTVEEARSYF